MVGIGIGYTFIRKEEAKPLPVINPVDIEPEMVDRDLVRQGIGHKIGEFTFTDQNGRPYGSKDLRGKIYVAEYFFTNCGTICPKMTAQMERVQEKFKGNKDVRIISLTVDPANDTVARMKEYAAMHNADGDQWHFLTGTQEELYKAARRYFFVLKPAEVKNQGDVGSDFIHTNNFVLIDRQQRIRGYYDGTSPLEVNQLMKDMDRLLAEDEH